MKIILVIGNKREFVTTFCKLLSIILNKEDNIIIHPLHHIEFDLVRKNENIYQMYNYITSSINDNKHNYIIDNYSSNPQDIINLIYNLKVNGYKVTHVFLDNDNISINNGLGKKLTGNHFLT